MAIAPRDTTRLHELYDRFQSYKPGLTREDFFPVLYATKKFRCAAEEVLDTTNLGDGSLGLDAYFLDREARNLYLLVCEWSEDHNKLKDRLRDLAKIGMEQLFGSSETRESPFLERFRADVQEFRELIDRVYVQCVFKGDAEAAEKSKGLSDRREELEGKSLLIASWFAPREVQFRTEFIADRRAPPPPPPNDTHEVGFVEKASLETPDKLHVLHIGFMRLMDLHRMHLNLGSKFFDRNIRAGLSPDNPPNRKIREALGNIAIRKTESPELFAFHHNGITIAALQVDFAKDKAVLRVPRLLNGAQTVSSLSRFLEDAEASPIKPDLAALERVQVIAKLVVEDPWSDFVTAITISNNQQNPVEPWNLRANDRIQCDLYDVFLEKLGLYYSRQENAFEALSQEELDDMGVLDTTKSLKIRPLAQTFLAAQGELALMTHLPEVFENQKNYEQTFKQRYVDIEDPRRIILAYKAGQMLNRVTGEMETRSAQWMVPSIRRSRSLIWALVIQGILNSPKLEALIDQFGRDLTHEHFFAEFLKDLGGVRILNVMKEVYAQPEYRGRIDEEKYTFVKTKELYSRCMDVARQKYDWSKRQL